MSVTDDINGRLGEIDAELEILDSLVDPTEDDEARSNELVAEGEALRAKRQEQIERREAIAAAHAKNKAEGRAIKGASFEFQKKVEPYEDDYRTMDRGQLSDAARAILDRPESRHLAPEQKERVEASLVRSDNGMSRTAAYVLQTTRPAYRSAFAKYISGREAMMTNEERIAVSLEDQSRTALQLADASGGYAVPALLDPAIIYTGNGSANPMRQVSRIVTGMDDTWRGVTSAGVTASWDSEAIEVSDDSPTLGQATVVSHKAAAFVQFTYEIADDWAGMAAEMNGLFQIAKDDLEVVAFATGNGTSDRPYGILTDLFAASGTVGVLPTTDGAFGAVDVRAIYASLGPRYRPNSAFMGSLDTINEIRGFDTTGGLSNQTVNLSASYEFAVLGRPVYENSGFPDFTGTTGAANILVVGDFSNYVVFDRVGSRLKFIPDIFGSSGRRPTGQSGLYYTWRVGGKTVNTSGFRLLLNT